MFALRFNSSLPKILHKKHYQIIRDFGRANFNNVNFEDHKSSFHLKSTLEIMRALFVLKLCSYDIFVNNSLTLMTSAEKILGSRLFGFFIRPTFYNQFVAGDDRESLSMTIRKLKETNVLPMIACMMEEDLNATEQLQEEKHDNNLKRIINCVKLLSSMSKQSCLQVKVTGLMPANLAVKINKNITDVEIQKNLAILFADAFKTGILYKKSPILKSLTDNEFLTLQKVLKRFRQIGSISKKENVTILIDAEYISMNTLLNTIALGMMIGYNEEKAIIWCTIQCYLKKALDTIKELNNITTDLNIPFGVKIVRGAYMEKERELAKIQNYPDPINTTYNDTGEMYRRVVDFVLERIKSSSKCAAVIATHNENSIRAALQKQFTLDKVILRHKLINVFFSPTNRIIDLELDFRCPQINFAQLYGMCEQITIPLAKLGVNVYKSIPYGTISETLPYLYRRATENRAVIKGARKEREMLWMEFKDRMKFSR